MVVRHWAVGVRVVCNRMVNWVVGSATRHLSNIYGVGVRVVCSRMMSWAVGRATKHLSNNAASGWQGSMQ